MNKDRDRLIKRGGVSSVSPKLHSKIVTTHCPDCEEKGIHDQSTILGERKYLLDEDVGSDAKEWRQCYLCGHTFHKVHVPPPEPELVSEIDELDNPYEEQSARIVGIDKRKVGKRGKHEQTKINLIKDPELKADIKKGAKLISYTETQP